MTGPKMPTLEQRIERLERDSQSLYSNISSIRSDLYTVEKSVKTLTGLAKILGCYSLLIFFILQQNKITKLKSELEDTEE
jgi:prefoldin subunit 5